MSSADAAVPQGMKFEIPVVTQKGKFRLQLSNMKITDSLLPAHLANSSLHLVELYSRQLALNPTLRPLSLSFPQPDRSDLVPSEGDEQRHDLGGAQRTLGDATISFADVPLIEITLNRNLLTDHAIPIIRKFIDSNPHIDSFEILGNSLTDASAPMIRDLIERSTLQRIKVGDNQITSEGATEIAQGLRNGHRNFVQLHVGGNPIGDEGVEQLCAGCRDSSVEVLGLRDVCMTERGWTAVASLCTAARSSIHEVQLKGNQLSPLSARCLAEIASSMPPSFCNNLTILSLTNCGITDNAARDVATFLGMNRLLQDVDLGGNPLGDDGLRCVLQWLQTDAARHMKTLSLQRTMMTVRGLEMLVEECKRPIATGLATLGELDLSFNEFNVEATPSVTSLISMLGCLRRLSLHRCLVGGAHLGNFCAAVLNHPTLKELDFSSNFSGEFGMAWVQVLTSSDRIERLLLTDNAMPPAVTSAIVTSIVKCTKRVLKTFQIGGQSKVDPVGNQVLPAAHTALSQALLRNRNERDGVVPPTPTEIKLPTDLDVKPGVDRRAIRQQLGYQAIPQRSVEGGKLQPFATSKAMPPPTPAMLTVPPPGALQMPFNSAQQSNVSHPLFPQQQQNVPLQQPQQQQPMMMYYVSPPQQAQMGQLTSSFGSNTTFVLPQQHQQQQQQQQPIIVHAQHPPIPHQMFMQHPQPPFVLMPQGMVPNQVFAPQPQPQLVFLQNPNLQYVPQNGMSSVIMHRQF